MATLAEVTAAIEAFNLATANAAAAETNLSNVEASVNDALVQESATFAVAQTLYTEQLQLARDAAGFPAAVTAVETSRQALEAADSNLKVLMAQYAGV